MGVTLWCWWEPSRPQRLDELLVLLTEEDERVLVVHTLLGLRGPRVGCRASITSARETLGWELLLTHREMQLRVQLAGRGHQAALAVGVATLQHQGLLEDLQADGALKAVLQLRHAHLPCHPRWP